ncbi:acetoacetyl-CoA reductase [Luteimonas sp. A534]
MSDPVALRTALVTGGTSGIGEAIALALHDAGHRVVVTCFAGVEEPSTWRDAQAAAGRTFQVEPVDVADYDSCQALGARLQDAGIAVDILVNDAGITRDATFRKMDKAKWDAVLRTDLDSMFNVSKPFVDGMADRGWGRIVNISSVNGTKGQFGQTNYSAAKAGVQGFTKALAQELARKGVTVNSVSPGYVGTALVKAMKPEIVESIVAQVPMGRLGKPEEIAAVVAFLCSEGAAYVTGANIAVNGGQHMG